MQRGDTWIRELLAIFPAERRKQCEGIDADVILRERTYLLDLITLLHTKWSEYFTAFETACICSLPRKHGNYKHLHDHQAP